MYNGPGSLVYLASPYSHRFKKVRHERSVAVGRLAYSLTMAGLNIFCPIAMSHFVNEQRGTGTQMPHEVCMRVDYEILSRCTALFVMLLPGWDNSKGVNLEIAFAKEYNIPIYFIDVDG